MVSLLRELVDYREVLFVLVWRDLKTRYRGSLLGFLWTLLNPLLLMAIYSLVFAVYVRVDIVAYSVFVFSGLLPWIWFSSAMSAGTNSIVEGGSFIKRVAFPPQVLPAVAVTATLVNFLLALPLLVLLIVWWGLPVRWVLLLLPIPVAIQFVFTLALTMGLSMLSVRYRDLQHLLANILTLWFFLTPVLYPPSLVPETLRPLLVINPMTLLIGAFQDIFYHARPPAAQHLAAAAGMAMLVLLAVLALGRRLRWRLVEEV